MSTPAQIAANRANAQKSTGPKTAEGKARSCRNAHKHGLYSNRIVQQHEDEDEYSRFRAALMAEHQPVNHTETFLVDELAQNGWKIRRLRAYEALAFSPDRVNACLEGLLAALSRALSAAERNVHRSLTALTKLQQQRGFVPQNRHDQNRKSEPAARLDCDSPDVDKPNPYPHPQQQPPQEVSSSIGFVPQNPQASAAPFATRDNQTSLACPLTP